MINYFTSRFMINGTISNNLTLKNTYFLKTKKNVEDTFLNSFKILNSRFQYSLFSDLYAKNDQIERIQQIGDATSHVCFHCLTRIYIQ